MDLRPINHLYVSEKGTYYYGDMYENVNGPYANLNKCYKDFCKMCKYEEDLMKEKELKDE